MKLTVSASEKNENCDQSEHEKERSQSANDDGDVCALDILGSGHVC